MTRDSLEARVLALLDDALEQPSDAREAFVRERCGGDRLLCDRALELLRAGSRSSRRFRTGGGPRSVEQAMPPPERIGAYRITGLIGQGGMGAVYRGERATGDFDHVAAIKLIRPGALSDALIERFQRERQTLARLAHPNIARLFDGGETEAGQPYMVMEHVDGLPLDAWLAAEEPTRAARIALFLGLCSAVGFAHQNLIIHRDITPSNILVAKDGTAKLIDFGIARPPTAEDRAPQPSRPSQRSLAGLSLTPGYAAPERLAGGSATTLSDIYSLGVLLGRMLEGSKDSDLAAIATKASAHEPEDRYASATALADDIMAWRDGLPVKARGGGRRYAAGKFIGRHRVGVAASATALLLLLAAFGTSTWSYVLAERARTAEAERFQDLRQLAGYMLFDLNERLERVAGNTEARASLAQEAQRYLGGLAASPAVDDSLRLETARGLVQLARIQGVPGQPSLGDKKRAKTNLLAAEAQLRSISPSATTGFVTAPLLASVQAYLGLIAILDDKDAKRSEALLGRSILTLDTVPRSQRGREWHEARRVIRHAQLDYAQQQKQGQIPALVGKMESDIGEWPPSMRRSAAEAFDRALAAYYRGLAATFAQSGDQGLGEFDKALAGFTAIERRAPNDPRLLYMIAWSGLDGFAAAAQTGNAPASARMIETAQAAASRLMAVETRDDSVSTLGHVVSESWSQHLANIGRYPEAIAAQREVIARESRRVAAEGGKALGVDLAFSEMILGVTARKAGDRNLTCQAYARAERRYGRVERLGKLTEFHAGFLPGLRKSVARCRAGDPLSAFQDLR